MAIGLRQRNRFFCVEANDAPAYHVFTDHMNLDSCSEVEVTPQGTGLVTIRFIGANRQFTITPEGAFETRNAGAIGPWETFVLAADGKSITNYPYGTTVELVGYNVGPAPTPGGPAQSFTVSGRDFLALDGTRRVLRGCDAFMALRIWLDKGDAGLAPFFAESKRLGFDLWRVFLQGAISQNQVMELRPYEYTQAQLRTFGQLLNANGIIPLATCFVDNQVIRSPLDQWFVATDALEGLVAIVSGGNEAPKNGFDPYAIPKPHGQIYWSRGSWTGDPNPYEPRPQGATFCEFHPNRDPVRGLMDATASPLTIWKEFGIGVPLIIDEPARFGTNGSATEFADPTWARAYGQVYSAMGAGAVFHNWFGQRGLVMDAATTTVAEAWQRGMRI